MDISLSGPGKGCLVDTLVAKSGCGDLAFGFIDDLSGAARELSFRELFSRSASLAATLQSCGLQGSRVLLAAQRNQRFVVAFFACLMAGAVAVPTPVPRRQQLHDRFERLAHDSGATALLGDKDEVLAFRPSNAPQGWVSLDLRAAPSLSAGDWARHRPAGEDLAFLQYTSGSTGHPKGVMVSHANLLANLRAIHDALGYGPESRQLVALPLFHDMGLVDGVLEPVFSGCAAYLMPPQLLAASPRLWLDCISRLGITISGGPNYMYELAAQLSSDELNGIDLSSWRVAFCGAEPVQGATAQCFAKKMAPHGFRAASFFPCYGMAEVTLFATGQPLDTEPRLVKVRERGHERTLVSCGKPAAGHEVAVVDPVSRKRLPDGAEGEIWLSGPSVAQGYWNNPEATGETFHARIADGTQARFLRTGDLGMLKDGDLFVTGRIKDLIIVRGRNIAPQDVEQAAQAAHPAIRPASCAAFMSQGAQGVERVVLALEVERVALHRPDEMEGIRKAVQRAVFDALDLALDEVVLLKPASLPKTSSGKLARSACGRAHAQGTFAVVPEPAREDPRAVCSLPWLQNQLASLARRSPQDVDLQLGFGDMGIDSLQIVQLSVHISTALKTEVDPLELYECGSLTNVHAWLGRSAGGAANVPQPIH